MIQPDVIGRIPASDPQLDENGNVLVAATWLPGWHVNAPEPVTEWEAYRCDPQPTTPYRVYAGGVTPVCYVFPDEATFLQECPDYGIEDPAI